MEIVVNLKTYKQGVQVFKLAKLIKKLNLENKIFLAVQPTDISLVKSLTKLRPYSQHVDFHDKGKNTGFIIPEAIKASGARGSLLNHSEHKIAFNDIKKTANRCKKIGLDLIICTDSLSEAKKIKSLKPYAIAYENSKLIGTGKSVTRHYPEDIKEFVDILKGTKTIPFCGAGISSIEDIIESKNLGCDGVLISSEITKSKNPAKLLKKMKSIK